MTARMIGLRALRHPLVLLSIGMLLLNDHVLKGMIPSAFTGKLSDFAGLFFFPFLLASLFGLVGDRLRLPVRGTGMLAFGVTGGWFALIKTVPLANAWTADLAGWLWGGRVQIVLDPTDLVALAVLWPAWGLWRRMERPAASRGQSPGRLAYLALGAASLAALATAACPPQHNITRLVVYEGLIYTRLIPSTAYYSVTNNIAFSANGLDWQWIDENTVPRGLLPLFDQAATLPLRVCDPSHPSTCFKISTAGRVESSTDRGVSWQTAWQVPWGRYEFMQRYLHSSLLACKRNVDPGPYDLALLPGEHGATLIVAMGNEGVLTRTPDGEWHRVALGNAEPTPFSGAPNGPGQVFFILLGEVAILLLGALLIEIVYTLVAARLMLLPAALPGGKSAGWAAAPLGWGILGLIGGLGLAGVLAFRWFGVPERAEELAWIPLVLGTLGFLAAPFVVWKRIMLLSRAPEQVRQAQKLGLGLGLGLFPLSWLPFVAWVYALIPLYVLAWALCVVIAVGCLAIAGVGLRRTARLARQRQAAALEEIAAGGEAVPLGQEEMPVSSCGEWSIFGVFWTLATWLAPLPGFTLSMLFAWGQLQALSWLFGTPLRRFTLGGALLGLLGWAGMKLARRAGLPAILSDRMRSPWRWLVLFLAGTPLGVAGGLIARLNAGDTFSDLQSPLICFGYAGTSAMGAEIVFRLFLLSALVALLGPRLQDSLGKRASLWVCIALAALLFSLANLPWFRYNEPTRLLLLFKWLYSFCLGLLAGRQFTRDGLSGAICIALGAELAWQIILPDLGY